MHIIEAKGTFTLTHLKEFMSSISDDGDILISSNYDVLTTKKNFFEDFWSFKTIDDELEIIISSNDAALIFTQADFNWWNKNQKRRDKLMSYESVKVKEKKVKETQISEVKRNVAIATKDSLGNLTDISTTFAYDSDVIQFLNEQIRTRTLMSFYKAQIVICIDYHDDENDSWKTLDELVINGQIKLK